MNIEYIVIGSIISKAVDWIVQTQWQAENKTKEFDALFLHSSIYAILTSVITLSIMTYISYTHMSQWIISILILFVSHMIIDNRYIVKLIMRTIKGLSWGQINGDKYGWLQIGIDQRLHEVVILIIGVIIK